MTLTGAYVVQELELPSLQHVPAVKALCRQLNPSWSPKQVDQEIIEMGMHCLWEPSRVGRVLSLTGAFQRGTGALVGYVSSMRQHIPTEPKVSTDAQEKTFLAMLGPNLSWEDVARLRYLDLYLEYNTFKRAGARPGDEALLVRAAVVDGGHRRRGVGSALLRQVKESAAQAGARFWWLIGEPLGPAACATYDSVGLVPEKPKSCLYLAELPSRVNSSSDSTAPGCAPPASSSSNKGAVEVCPAAAPTVGAALTPTLQPAAPSVRDQSLQQRDGGSSGRSTRSTGSQMVQSVPASARAAALVGASLFPRQWAGRVPVLAQPRVCGVTGVQRQPTAALRGAMRLV